MHARLSSSAFQHLFEAAERVERAERALRIGTDIATVARRRYHALLVEHGFDPERPPTYNPLTQQVIPGGPASLPR